MIDLYYWPTPNGHKASVTLEELGLEVQVRRRWVESRREFAVLAMEPEPGTVVPPGSEVQITIND